MRTIYVWGATGTDPRFEGKEVRMYFGFKPSLADVVLTLQSLLGYMPDVADTFPMSEPILAMFEDEYSPVNEAILSENLRVQMPGVKEELIKAGTRVQLLHEYEVLYSEPGL